MTLLIRSWYLARSLGRVGPIVRADDDPEAYGLPPYPKGEVVGPCVCGSWPGGKCLKCPVQVKK